MYLFYINSYKPWTVGRKIFVREHMDRVWAEIQKNQSPTQDRSNTHCYCREVLVKAWVIHYKDPSLIRRQILGLVVFCTMRCHYRKNRWNHQI